MVLSLITAEITCVIITRKPTEPVLKTQAKIASYPIYTRLQSWQTKLQPTNIGEIGCNIVRFMNCTPLIF